jgi:hypothetical protein
MIGTEPVKESKEERRGEQHVVRIVSAASCAPNELIRTFDQHYLVARGALRLRALTIHVRYGETSP